MIRKLFSEEKLKTWICFFLSFSIIFCVSVSAQELNGLTITKDYLTLAGSPVLFIRDSIVDTYGAGARIDIEDLIFTSFKDDSYAEYTKNGIRTTLKRHRDTLEIPSKDAVIIGKNGGPAIVYKPCKDGIMEGGIFDLGLDGPQLYVGGRMNVSDIESVVQSVLVLCKDKKEADRFVPVADALSKVNIEYD